MLVRQLWILLSLSHWNFEELSAIRNLSCRPSAQWTGWDYTAKLHSLHRWCCYGYLAKATSVTVHRPGHDQDLLDSNWVSMMCTACQKSLKPKCTTRYHTISQWLSLLSSPSCIILVQALSASMALHTPLLWWPQSRCFCRLSCPQSQQSNQCQSGIDCSEVRVVCTLDEMLTKSVCTSTIYS